MIYPAQTLMGLPMGKSSGPATTAKTTAATDIPPDCVDLSELPASAKRVAPIPDARAAMDVRPPVVARPLLMVHGLAQHADTWSNMKLFLCSDACNQWGGVYSTDREAEFLNGLSAKPDAKIFALDLSDNLAAPRVVANEVRRAVDAICAATGATQVDVMTHSMGSLVTREAIRQGEDRIANLCMIAPPNHGSYEATLASGLHDGGVYDHYPESRMGAMDALRLEFGEGGGVRNQWLHDLNADFATNPHKPRSVVIAGVGIPTPDRALKFVTAQGDGMVAARRAPLDGADFFLAVPNKLAAGDPNFRDFQEFRYNHLQVVSEPEIYQQVSNFLVGGGAAAAGAPAVSTPVSRPPLVDYLNTVQDRSRDIRKEVAANEFNREHFSRWTRNGVIMTALGAGLTVAGIGLGGVAPTLGLLSVAGGIVNLGAGLVISVLNSRRLGHEVARMAKVTEEGMNLTDTLAHRVRDELARPPQPTAGGAPLAGKSAV